MFALKTCSLIALRSPSFVLAALTAAESFSPSMLRFLMPCHVLNFSSQPVDALSLRSAASVFNCVEKCFAFSWRSRPEIGVPEDLCWINQVYRALSYGTSSASFRDFRFNPSLVSMLSENFRILSLFFRMSEICCLLMPNSWAKFVPFSLFDFVLWFFKYIWDCPNRFMSDLDVETSKNPRDFLGESFGIGQNNHTMWSELFTSCCQFRWRPL